MAGHNPRTEDEARAFVAHVESLFMPWNIDGLLAGFTEDCVVKFGDLPELRGKPALEKLFRSRMERQKLCANVSRKMSITSVEGFRGRTIPCVTS